MECRVRANNLGVLQQTVTEERGGGTHAVYFSKTIPDQGAACSLKDRAIIEAAGQYSTSLLSVALAALASGSDVKLQVDGCISALAAESTSSPTAAKITKIHMYK